LFSLSKATSQLPTLNPYSQRQLRRCRIQFILMCTQSQHSFVALHTAFSIFECCVVLCCLCNGILSSPSWTLLQPEMTDVVEVTTGTPGGAKLQLNHHHQQHTNTQVFTGRMSFLSPNQQCQSSEWIITINVKNLSV